MNGSILPKKYQEPFQIWKVTTEGDCEGRSTRDLGIHRGYIDEIAFALADKVMYSLQFKPVTLNDLEGLTTTRNEVDISFDIDSKTWNMSAEDRAMVMRSLLSNRPVDVRAGNYFASVKLSRKETEEQKQMRLHKTAIEKVAKCLSPEEFQALGLDRTK